MRPQDLKVIWFFFGASLAQLILCIFFTLFMPRSYINVEWDGASTINAFARLLFVLSLLFFLSGVNVEIFRRYEINYMHIFDADHHFKITMAQFYKIGALFFAFFSTFLSIVYIEISFDYLDLLWEDSKRKVQDYDVDNTWFENYFGAVVMIILILLCVQPVVNILQRAARMELMKVIFMIVISPFGTVRFRDFFFADVLTSMGQTAKDFGIIFQHITVPSSWTEDTNLSHLKTYNYVVAILPFWWRFWQCIRKGYLSGNNMQFVNAAKYISKIIPTVLVI
mmetsp:Transcript_8674/g.14707  ORF Transcript_8674/g.14707 Transcript_8674/m.14707 type:complete len:281 (+) Transcript_8674:1441-2283(+)